MPELGDMVSGALSSLGISAEVVGKWLGTPCHCDERREKLNALSAWAKRVVRGKMEGGKQFLSSLTGQELT